ncbi:hypothetical protein [Fibrobacter sp.]|uniref:hypothetical protein n=1 Tax=Fibrobacter sp. TaxID=35828 RepID=UPI0025BE2AA3|nr:hypothetical protein [Fibrobacter sp.]MBR3072990.1 hypothetical protein [Fibrobacter sp.]
MKKTLIPLLALAVMVWAEVKIEMAVRVEKMPETLFDFYNWDENCGDFGCWGENRTVCSTDLDSNILYGCPYEGETIEFYVFTGATHSWRDVFENQLKRYRKCAKGTANDSTYNAVITEIESVLVSEIEKESQSNNKYSKQIIYDYAFRTIMGHIDGPGPVFEFYDYAMDSVKVRNAAISSIVPAKYKLETIRVQNHRLTISPKLFGRDFVLFDVNGHELRRGTLQNNMQLPAYPTVIKIQGLGTRLLK